MLSILSRGSPIEKLSWIFSLYDIKGDGIISKEEMIFVVSSVYELLGESTLPVVEANSAEDHVQRIFEVSHCFSIESIPCKIGNSHFGTVNKKTFISEQNPFLSIFHSFPFICFFRL
jgi:hypothetical protein